MHNAHETAALLATAVGLYSTVHAHEPIPQVLIYRNRLRGTLLGLDALHSNPPFLETDLMGGGGGR